MGSPLIPNDEEILKVLRRCQEDLILSGNKPEANDFVPEKALEFLKSYAHLHMVGGYLVAFIVDTPWFAKTPTLVELLMVRMIPGGSFKDVIEFFEAQARAFGCNRIASGTLLATDDKVLASLYQRQGFHVSAWQLCKEVS